MLQKKPNLTQAQIESILEGTVFPLPPGCRGVTVPRTDPGNHPTWSDAANVFFFDATVCWGADGTGAGLLQADAALGATPLP